MHKFFEKLRQCVAEALRIFRKMLSVSLLKNFRFEESNLLQEHDLSPLSGEPIFRACLQGQTPEVRASTAQEQSP
jgi:hypothetical protein